MEDRATGKMRCGEASTESSQRYRVVPLEVEDSPWRIAATKPNESEVVRHAKFHPTGLD